MARYKHTDSEDGQGLFSSVNLKEQLLPGTFEYMIEEKFLGDRGIKWEQHNSQGAYGVYGNPLDNDSGFHIREP
jgi:hypothetical protein